MKILFYSPMQYIWQHSIPFSTIAESLSSDGHEVFTVSCFADFETCPALELAESIKKAGQYDKMSTCLKCKKMDYSFFKPTLCKKLNISQLEIDKKYKIALNEYKKHERYEDLIKFKYNDSNIGTYALYDTVLRFKKKNTYIDSREELEYFNKTLKSALKSLLIAEELYDKYQFDRVVIYSPQYSINRPVADYFNNKQVPVFFTEAGVNLSNRLDTLRIWKWSDHYLVNPALKFKKVDLTNIYFDQIQEEELLNHFKELFLAKSHMVYSTKADKNFDFHKVTGAPKGVKIFMLTMSSFDEAFSAYLSGLFPKEKACSSVYPDPIDWVKDTINFARENQDIFLIIRLHPRDFPNKRESGISEQGKQLLNSFINLPTNVFICQPTDGISLYNLLPHVDILITGWSATALEAGILGLPVVVYDSELPSFPLLATQYGTSRLEYISNLSKAKLLNRDFSYFTSTINWLHINGVLGSPKILKFFNLAATSSNIFFKIIRKLMIQTAPGFMHKILILIFKDTEGISKITQIIIKDQSSLFADLVLSELSQKNEKNKINYLKIKKRIDKLFQIK